MCRLSCLAFALIVLAPVGAAASGGLRTVALSGQPAPGAAPGITYTTFASPAIDGAGRTAFEGSIEGPGVIEFENDEGIWIESAGAGLTLLALAGEMAPGTVENFRSLDSDLAFSRNGMIAIAGTAGPFDFSTPGVEGYWTNISGTLEAVVLEGDAAVGTSELFEDFDAEPAINASGQIAYVGQLTSSATDTGLWRYTPGTGAILIAREGDPAPGLPAGVLLGAVEDDDPPRMNTAGQISYVTGLTGEGIGETNDEAVWVSDGSTHRLVAQTGNTAPGAGLPFVGLSDEVAIDAQGRVAFDASLSDNFEVIDQGVWSEGAGAGLALVARSGQTAPGSNEVFESFSDPIMNASGVLALEAFLADGSFSSGLWKGTTSADLHLIAKRGDAAPESTGMFDFIGTVAINGAGQVAFTADLTDSSDGLWAQDSLGTLRRIVGTGDQIDVSDEPGSPDLRTVAELNFQGNSGNEDGLESGFNDRGQIAFRATFTDGTAGVFVSDLVMLLPGDANGDGAVDILDLDILSGNFGATGVAAYSQGDFNGDGAVDILDLDILSGAFGSMMSGTTVIPEPASLAMAFSLMLCASAPSRPWALA